jgi:hypothetical protein
MIDLITGFLDSKIDYQTIFAIIGLYLLSLWLMFCLWVFVDANKRYNKPVMGLFMALLVFVFNFPALVFYLIIRPESDEFADFANLEGSSGGVQVPLVNFVGENGEIQMSFNVQIQPQLQPKSDMVINVGWESDNSNMRLGSSAPRQAQQPSTPGQTNEAFRKHWDAFRSKAKDQIKNINATVSSSVNSAAGGESTVEKKTRKAKHNES